MRAEGRRTSTRGDSLDEYSDVHAAVEPGDLFADVEAIYRVVVVLPPALGRRLVEPVLVRRVETRSVRAA